LEEILMAPLPLNRRRLLKSGLAASAAALSTKLGAPAAFAAPAVQGTTNLRVMVWGRPNGANWAYESFRRAAPDAAANVTVEPIVGGPGDGEVAEQFRLLLSAGGQDMPDVIMLNRTQVPEFAAAGVLTDLTDRIAPYREDMIDSAVQLASFDDRVIAVPNQLKSKIWYYRADLLEEAGVDPDAVPDIDAFVEAAKAYHAAKPDSFLFNMRADPPGYLLQNILTSTAPISFYDREAGRFQVDTHAGFRTLYETLDKLRDPEVAAPVDDFTPDWSPAFADGRIASSLINEWMTQFLPLYAPDQGGRWGAHAWPAIAGSNKGSDAGGSVFVIPAMAPNPDAAFEMLAQGGLTRDGALAKLEIAGTLPYVRSAREVVPTMPKPEAPADVQDPIPWAPDFFGEEYFPVVFEAEERMTWIDFSPSAAREMDLLGQWTQRFVAGEVGIDETLQGLQSDLEGQIGDPWQV
jgi:ABC-type glycerol-3-phosphate transport system substrate-binding protein